MSRDHPGRTVVAEVGITWGNSRALCTEDALEGQLKLKCMQVGMSWGSPHRGEKDRTAEAEERASWNIPRCSVSWRGVWSQGRHGPEVPMVLCEGVTLVGYGYSQSSHQLGSPAALFSRGALASHLEPKWYRN